MTQASGKFRPTVYDQATGGEILTRLADGQSLREVCRAADMPSRETVRRWLHDDATFRAHYAQACQERADSFLEEIIEVAHDSSNDYMDRRRQDGTVERVLDPESVNRSRLRIATLQWAMAKVAPRKYGDKVAIGGDPDAPPVRVDDLGLARRLTFLLVKGMHQNEEGGGQ